ncbi:MAG: hypothetical protein ACFHVJ_10865 [Aestuariibacter sp.]
MSPDELEKLLPYTDKMNLSKAQRIEIVKTVWGLMESFVDEALGLHPVQLTCEQLEPDHLQSHNHDSKINSSAYEKSK